MIFKSVAMNKTKTAFITVLFFLFIALFVYFLTILFGGDANAALVIATFVSSITSLISYYNCDKMVLKLNNARKATRDEYLQLNESLEALCIGAGLPLPSLYIIDDNALNAFATGRNPSHAVVCVTKGDRHTFDISSSIRMVNTDDFGVKSCDEFYGFICGMISQNFDITHIFIDSITKITKVTVEEIDALVKGVCVSSITNIFLTY